MFIYLFICVIWISFFTLHASCHQEFKMLSSLLFTSNAVSPWRQFLSLTSKRGKKKSDRFNERALAADWLCMWRALTLSACCSPCACPVCPLSARTYYCSHSAPRRARPSIWAVVLAVCSNLLLFNCLTAAAPTDTAASREKLNRNAGHLFIKMDKMRLT